MGPVCGPLVLLLSIFSSQALAVGVKVHFEPMVAFVNGKPAMRHTENGWEASTQTGYLTNKFAILKFCKQSYPRIDIRNIVEMNEAIIIQNWCIKGKECATEKVIPYRCLVGEFQSDALLVPEGCKFDHVHDKHKCQGHDGWKRIAEEKCAAQDAILSRYSMLRPCETDLFEGVEYVCCPKKGGKPLVTKKETVQPKVSKDIAKHVEKSKDMAKHMEKKRKEHNHNKKMTHKKMEQKKPAFDSYQKYKHMGLKSKYTFEHQKYKQAFEKLEKTQHEKMTSVMKEWANHRERIQAMKETDPKGATRMEKEVSDRFKKTYQALEQENRAEKSQLLAFHEQHILANINEKKRKSLDKFTEALNEHKPEADKIVKFLQRYIRAEGKDREHTIKHFAHVRNHHPKDLEQTRQYTLKHLKQIEDRINQSLQLVERLDDAKLVAKIKNRVSDFMRKYHKDMDMKLSENILKPLPPVSDAAVVEQYKNHLKQEATKENEHHEQIKSNKILTPKKEDKSLGIEMPREKKVGQPVDFPEDVNEGVYKDDETYEDEHLYIQPKHNAALKNTISLEENELYVSKKETHNLVSASSITGIVIGSLVAFVIIIAAIVMVRRRSSRSPADSGFIEVSQAVSPEERHVMNMQSDGYENPTYKFFELQGQ